MGSIIQIYASANPADNMASVDIPGNGNIVGVSWAVRMAPSSADFQGLFALSFGSTNSFTSNDARAVLSMCVIAADLTTSGAAPTSVVYYDQCPNLPVAAGERVFLHGSGTAITATVYALLHLDFTMDKIRTRLR